MFRSFGFGRKKTKREDAEPVRSAHSVADLSLQRSEVTDFVAFALGEGHFFGTLYAIMQGFEGAAPAINLEEYATLLEKEPSYSESGIERARAEFFEMLNGASSSEVRQWNTNSDSIHRKVAKCVAENGAARVFQSIGLDAAEYLKNETERRRRVDLNLVWHALRKKRDHLAPIFRSALSRGRNKYGDLDYGHLIKEIEEFCAYAFPEGTLKFFYILHPHGFIHTIINDWLMLSSVSVEPPIDGVAFEHWCGDRLAEQGWAVTVSQASGDQGVDIIVSQGGKTVAVQCKRYEKPIGNKAVQEAFSGKQHYGANAACVIGSGGFTRSAFELARSTDVKLLDYQMINEFSKIYGEHGRDDSADTSSDEHFYLYFSTPAEKAMGRLFRTVAIAHADQARLDEPARTKTLTLIDEDGAGELGCSNVELAGFVALSALVLNGRLSVSENNRQKLVESGFPNSAAVLDLPIGHEMRMYELLGDELFGEVQALIRAWSDAAGFETDAIDTILSV